MTGSTPLQLTPEQIAAVTAAGGVVRAEDPTTHTRYLLVEERQETTLPDEYIREKVAEGLASLDRGEGIPWDLNEQKARLAQRLNQRSQS